MTGFIGNKNKCIICSLLMCFFRLEVFGGEFYLKYFLFFVLGFRWLSFRASFLVLTSPFLKYDSLLIFLMLLLHDARICFSD